MKKTHLYAFLMACMLCFGTQARASTCEAPEYETRVVDCYLWFVRSTVLAGSVGTTSSKTIHSLNSIRAIAEHQGEPLPLVSEAVAEVIDLLREHGNLEESEAYAKNFYQLALCYEASTSESKDYLKEPDFKDITLDSDKQFALILAFGATLIKKLSDPECQYTGEALLQSVIDVLSD